MFDKNEFVLVEEFYELLKSEFEKRSMSENWGDFMQSYDYDCEEKCTFSYYATSKKTIKISGKGSFIKKKWFYYIQLHLFNF